MENAAKALTMAGSVLIALMIIGALLLMFNNLSSYQKTNVQNTREAQIIEFNNQYETYNRTDVRGSNLCSLLNKAADYNERKSSAGTEGAEIAYTPMTITVIIDSALLSSIKSPDGNNLIIAESYSVTGTTNEFEEEVQKEIYGIEEYFGGQEIVTKLVTNMSKIFDAITEEEAKKVYKDITKNEVTWNELNGEIRTKIYEYYEYIQFKRAYFDCTSDEKGSSGVEYDKNTGRIISMTFRYNGKIE